MVRALSHLPLAPAMTFGAMFGTLGIVLLASSGCPASYVNKDGVYKQASLLPAVKDFPDKDGIDAEKGDVSDWKYVEPSRDGKGHLLVSVGDPFAAKNRHGVADGRVEVKNANADTLANAKVVSGKSDYELEFDVKKGERIYIVFEAAKGKAPYRMTFEVRDAGPDPCSLCTEDQICKDNECVEPVAPPPPRLCDPKCRRGHFCLKGREGRPPRCIKRREKGGICPQECERIFDVTAKFIKINYGGNKEKLDKKMSAFRAMRSAGQPDCGSKCSSGYYDLACLSGISSAKKIPSCRVPCGGPCRRGWDCNEETNKCERGCKSCSGVTCGEGKRCRCGRCVKKKEPIIEKPACDPPCKSGYTCNKATGKCKVQLGPIGCRIIQVIPAGPKTDLLLSRGQAHRVAVGDQGSVPGVGTFTVRKVFPNRSKARINKPSSAVAGVKKCSINRKNWKP